MFWYQHNCKIIIEVKSLITQRRQFLPNCKINGCIQLFPIVHHAYRVLFYETSLMDDIYETRERRLVISSET